jgi:hypothetical protein
VLPRDKAIDLVGDMTFAESKEFLGGVLFAMREEDVVAVLLEECAAIQDTLLEAWAV